MPLPRTKARQRRSPRVHPRRYQANSPNLCLPALPRRPLPTKIKIQLPRITARARPRAEIPGHATPRGREAGVAADSAAVPVEAVLAVEDLADGEEAVAAAVAVAGCRSEGLRESTR